MTSTFNDTGPSPEVINPPPRPCQVFLIEDDFDDRVLAVKELQSSEHVSEIKAFRDGKELTDYMHESGFNDHSLILYQPILLLVDLEMPRKNGLEIIKEIKSDPFLKPIPLVVVSGTENKEKLRKARELGASGVFRKPLSKDMLHTFFNDAWQWPPPEMW
jgi:CheY-like chemotaxis protein